MAKKKNSKKSKSKKKSESKDKSKSPKTYTKCVKQLSIPIAEEDFDCLMHDAEQYQHCRNYMYSRYSGINSMPLLKNHRRLIRDELMKKDKENKDHKKGFSLPVLSWELPARLWKLALDDAVGGIKSAQTSTINRVRDIVRKHDGLNDEEKHFCFWVLCSDTRIHHVLKHHALAYPDDIWSLKVDKRNLLNRIRRWFREKKNKISCSRSCTSYMLDSGLYKYGKDRLGTYLDISVYQRPRIRVYLRDQTIVSKGNLQLILHPESRTIEIHRTIEAKVKKKSKDEKKTVYVHVEGADKGMTEMLHLSNGHVYGAGLGKLITAESDWIKAKWQKRNPYEAKARELEKAGNSREAEKIRQTYLGRKAYIQHRKKFEGTLKTFINAAIRKMFQTENLKELVLEDLTWVSERMKKPKDMNRRLHHWTKGYLQERLEYYAEIYGVKITMINPAHTSKVCHKCGCRGIRKGKVFTCPHCGQMDADDNAAKNIKARKYDQQITLHMNKDKVKGILEARYWKKRNSTLPAVIPPPGSAIFLIH